MEKQTAKAIQDYSSQNLPQKSGESILVFDIGAIALGDEYKVEKVLNYYEITKY